MTILVVGEALIDIVSGPGVPDRYAPGGSPANVALGLGRLGAAVELLTDVGDDFHGGFLLAHLRESRVTVRADPRGSTSRARAVLDEDGSADYEFSLRWAPDASLVADSEFSALHIGSIATFLHPGAAVIDQLLSRGLAAGARITFDPNIRPSIIGERDQVIDRFETLASRVDVIKLSDEDATWLYPDLDVETQIHRLLSLGAGLVFLTRGPEPSVLSTVSARVPVPAVKVEVVDTIGAGDSVMASLLFDLRAIALPISELGEGVLTELGESAARRAGITVSRSGADLPWAREEGR